MARLYGVMDRRLAEQEFLAGDYSIADIATYPWVARHERHQTRLEDFPHVKRWFDSCLVRFYRRPPCGPARHGCAESGLIPAASSPDTQSRQALSFTS